MHFILSVPERMFVGFLTPHHGEPLLVIGMR